MASILAKVANLKLLADQIEIDPDLQHLIADAEDLRALILDWERLVQSNESLRKLLRGAYQ